MHGEILSAACTEFLLMMNTYLFETYRGQFKWNKYLRKSVHLLSLSHVRISEDLHSFIIIIIVIMGTTTPFWAKTFFRSLCQLFLFLAAFLQFLSPNFLASSITPFFHLSFGLPLCFLPSTTATRTLLARLCSTGRIMCAAHLRRLILLYVTTSFSLYSVYSSLWPPLWSSGQSFWLQIQRSRVRFPALPDFLSSSGSGTGSTQPREVNWGATWIKSCGSGLENRD